MNASQLATLAQSIRARLVDYPPHPALGESLESFNLRRADDQAAAGLARYVAAQHGGGADFLRACGLRPGLPRYRSPECSQ